MRASYSTILVTMAVSTFHPPISLMGGFILNMKNKTNTEEEIFEKVIENEYNIDLILHIIFPLISIFLGFLFGFFQHKDMGVYALLTGYLLGLFIIFYITGFSVLLSGRKVYWRKKK
jgi:hypothetical protein